MNKLNHDDRLPKRFRSAVMPILILFLIVVSPLYAEITTCFTPYEDCEAKFIDVIDSAQHDIKISCFGLTNEDVAKALVEAKNRGVIVLVCVDKMQSGSKHDKKNYLQSEGIEVIVKKTSVLEHNKMIIADGKHGIIGSWNISKNANKQDNSMVIFKDEPLFAEQIESAILRIYDRDKE